MANGLYPAFFEANYHSAYGPHTMTVPLKDYNGPTEDWAAGYCVNWSDVNVSASEMVDTYIESLLPNLPDTVEFDYVTFYKYPSPTGKPRPLASYNFVDMVGSSMTPGWTKAVELALSFHTTEFGIFGIRLLDAASANNFDKLTSLSTLTAVQPIIDIVTSVDWAFAGRDNARPASFIQMSKTLNVKLRKAYRMN